MSINLKYSVRFSIKNNQKDTPTPVRMRVSFNSLRPELYISVSAKPSEWNFENQTFLNKKDRRVSDLTKAKSAVDEIFKIYELIHKRYPTTDELKVEFATRVRNKQSKVIDKGIPLHKLKKMHIEQESEIRQWSDNTIKNHNKLINHLKHFFKSKTVDQLTEKNLSDFIRYLQANPLDKKGNKTEPHKNATLRREFRDLKQMLIWAEKKGLYNGNVHKTFSPRFKGTEEKLSDVIFLTWEELIKLFNHTFDNESWNEIRDVYCFCAFTSLRFSDVEKFKKSHIRENSIVVATKKTTEPLIIDLNDYSRSILEKYKELQHPKGLALPVPSQKHLNEHIKKIGEKLGFNEPVREVYFIGNKYHEHTFEKWQLLSSHSARRTFIVAALTLGIPVEVIIRWTGHKDYEAMKPYIKIVDELKKKEMSKFNLPPKIPPQNS